jgi:hypothetical protein
MGKHAGAILAATSFLAHTAMAAAPAGYPLEVQDILYTSTADNSNQPALFYSPSSKDPVPLLVALHTWSSDYKQGGGETLYAKWCVQAGWAFIHPNFRGPNWTPQALGSDLMVGDILSAVNHAKANANIDSSKIYGIGVSGGGHASMLMAGRAPELWAGVSAWCGISDIALWHAQCKRTKFGRYATHIEKALGGEPITGSRQLDSANFRSPVTWLKAAAGVNLDINHGINDGRAGSVPFVHSLHAWNAIVPEEQRFSPDEIQTLYETRKSQDPAPTDTLYGEKRPLLRQTHGNTRITLFEGGHEIVHHAALNWLAAQQKGTPAKWEIEETKDYLGKTKSAQSGK